MTKLGNRFLGQFSTDFVSIRYSSTLVILAFSGVFWYGFKTFIEKRYLKSLPKKYLGFVKLGIRGVERDIKHRKIQIHT